MKRFKEFCEELSFIEEEQGLRLVLEGMSLFEGIPNPAMTKNKEVDQLDRAVKSGRIDDSEAAKKIKKIMDGYERKIETVKKDFEKLIRSEIRKFPKVKFLSATKPLSSIEDKVIKRKKPLSELNDLVRGAVLFETKEDADDFIKRFVRKNKSKVAELETKERGSDTTYGYYGAYHLLLDVGGILVELQVMTKKLWNYKKNAHDIYTRSRSKPGGPDKFDRHMSKLIFSKGNLGEENDEEDLDNSDESGYI